MRHPLSRITERLARTGVSLMQFYQMQNRSSDQQFLGYYSPVASGVTRMFFFLFVVSVTHQIFVLLQVDQRASAVCSRQHVRRNSPTGGGGARARWQGK